MKCACGCGTEIPAGKKIDAIYVDKKHRERHAYQLKKKGGIDRKIDGIDGKIDGKIDGIDGKIARIDEKNDGIGGKIDLLSSTLRGFIEETNPKKNEMDSNVLIQQRFDDLNKIISELKTDKEKIETRCLAKIDKLEEKIEKLKEDNKNLERELAIKDDRHKLELSGIEASGEKGIAGIIKSLDTEKIKQIGEVVMLFKNGGAIQQQHAPRSTGDVEKDDMINQITEYLCAKDSIFIGKLSVILNNATDKFMDSIINTINQQHGTNNN